MSNITTLLLKHGIEGLLSKNEDFFKQNITQALAMKLNESVGETKKAVAKTLLYRQENTKPSENLVEFINFVNKFKPGNYTFKNGSSINITESEMNLLKSLFESLSPENREKMISDILEDGTLFKQHITFSQKVRKLL
jgi:hypothetical protein